MFSDFPSLHPLVIHFPVVLILMAAIFQVLVTWKPHWQEIRWATLFVMGGAFFSALAASTLFHAMIAPDAPQAAMAVFEEHEKYAQLTLWTSGITLLLKCIDVLFKINRRLYDIIVLAASIIAAIFLSIAGHHGARLTHIEGVGPKGMYLMKNHGGHDEKDMEGMGMPNKGGAQMNDSTQDMKDMPGMDNKKNMKGMGNMKDMPGMDNKKSMKDMDNMKDMPGMDNKKSMKGMGNMKDMPGMDIKKNMKDMDNMKDMLGMDNKKNMKGMDNMKDMPDMDNKKNMKDMPGMDNKKNMKGMDNMKDMSINAMDSLRFPDNNPARKMSKKPVKQ